MRLRALPKKPKRITFKRTIEVEGFTLGEVVSLVKEQGGDPAKARIEEEYDYGDSHDVIVSFDVEETDAEFDDRMALHEEAILSYTQWKKTHKVEIEAEKSKRLMLDKEKASRKIEDYKKKLRAEESRLAKTIAKLG